MELLETKAELRRWVMERGTRPRVFVPTMGALHRGHTSLFDLAKAEAGDGDTVASIFVNPTQFGPNEDFEAYPRPLDADLEKCGEHRVAAVFAPAPGEMYSDDASISIRENSLSTLLCGSSRPGHFDGVCTVVAKLFHLVRPDAAVFGEKDFQQLAVIRRLVRDLDMPVRILPGPTVREEDGLALSSRNVYLSGEEREQAPAIHRALSETARRIRERGFASPAEAASFLRSEIGAIPLARIDYAEIVDSASLRPLEQFGDGEPRLVVAVYFGKTRLIDNIGIS